MKQTTHAELQRIWDRFLQDTERFESGRTLGLASEDFRMDGELKGVSSFGWNRYGGSGDGEEIGLFEADEAGRGVEDFALLDSTPDSVGIDWETGEELFEDGRWAHERDAYLAGQAWEQSTGLGGRNPRPSYLYSCSHEREERFRKILHRVRTAPLPVILKARRDKTLRKMRNESIAKTLGFSSVPKGPWPGVEWSDEHKALIRRYTCPETGAEVTRVGDFSRVYLTKAQLKRLEEEMDKRCHAR